MLGKLLIALLLPALARAVVDTETIRQDYPASPRLEVRNVNGAVRVTASNGGAIRLVATKRIDADDQGALTRAKSEVRLDVQQDGSQLRICVVQVFTDCQENSRGNFRFTRWREDYVATVDLELQVPANIALDLKSVNGAVSATGTRGAFQLKSVNGAVTAKDLEGAGEANTVNGAVYVSVAGVSREGLRAKTVNGSIEAFLPKALNADLTIKTAQGEVFTSFPPAAMVSQNLQPIGGARTRRNKNLSFRLNGGGPAVSFQTVNGSVQIAER